MRSRRGRRRGGIGRGIATGIGIVAGASIAKEIKRSAMRNWDNSLSQKEVSCFSCGRRNQPNNHYCGFCGADMFNDPRGAGLQCDECGFVCESDTNFCSNCGIKFNER